MVTPIGLHRGDGPGLQCPSLKVTFVQKIASSSPGKEGPRELNSVSTSELMRGLGSRACWLKINTRFVSEGFLGEFPRQAKLGGMSARGI